MVARPRFLLLGLLLSLAACGPQPAPSGGMSDAVATATATVEGPGFLTPTPPQGAFVTQVNPPPGGLEATPTPVPATVAPTAAVTRRATSSTSSAALSSGTAAVPGGASPTPFQTPTPEATDTPVPVTQESASEAIFVNMATPAAVQRGATATVQATTTVPGAICTLTVRYRASQSSPAPEFPVHTADANGSVSWSWMVPPDVFVGDWPATVRCQVGLPLNDPSLPYGFGTKLLPVR